MKARTRGAAARLALEPDQGSLQLRPGARHQLAPQLPTAGLRCGGLRADIQSLVARASSAVFFLVRLNSLLATRLPRCASHQAAPVVDALTTWGRTYVVAPDDPLRDGYRRVGLSGPDADG